MLVLEYDGFEFYFAKGGMINSSTWRMYLTAEDLEREKVLESFGVQMIRLNKFNLGKDPVASIDGLLRERLDGIKDRVARAVEFGARIHPQYRAEYENGIAVAWHRVPFTFGCAGNWTDEARAEHYNNLCQIDGRIVLAGEHASYIPAWQEGAILSSLDAITRLHDRVVKT